MNLEEFGGVAKSLSNKALDAHEKRYAEDAPVIWDFGSRKSTVTLSLLENVAPRVLDNWDGKTCNPWPLTKNIIHHGKPGEFFPAQKQTRGTCVGRGASGALNVLQAILIDKGEPIEFKCVSHAWCYAGARMRDNILGPEDGAIGKSSLLFCQEKGIAHQLECDDTDYFSDDLAVRWGSRGIPSQILTLGTDNLAKFVVEVRSAKQAADVISAGGVVTIASNGGFKMERNSLGICDPQGTWMHQMYIASVHVLSNGRKVFGIAQSWGENVPSGPLLENCPSNVFGADWDVVDRLLSQGDSAGCALINPWKADQLWRF